MEFKVCSRKKTLLLCLAGIRFYTTFSFDIQAGKITDQTLIYNKLQGITNKRNENEANKKQFETQLKFLISLVYDWIKS